MKRDSLDLQRDDLLDLLRIWHRHEARWVPVNGYPQECPSTRGWRASRQYDSENGADETDAIAKLAKHVQSVVDSMREPHRTAIHVLARHHATGHTVWGSARLPQDRDECASVMAAAMEIFAARV